MEDIFVIPELVNMLFDGQSYSDYIRMIAKFRMVCHATAKLFAVIVREETKTRAGVTFMTMTYTVRDIFGRELYRNGPESLGFLRKIWIDRESDSVPIEDSHVIHVQPDGTVASFRTDPEEFVLINQLFGLRAAAYGTLLVRDKEYSEENILVTNIMDDGIDVTVGDESYWLGLLPHSDEPPAAYYIFYGQLHYSDNDIGNNPTICRLKRLTW